MQTLGRGLYLLATLILALNLQFNSREDTGTQWAESWDVAVVKVKGIAWLEQWCSEKTWNSGDHK